MFDACIFFHPYFNFESHLYSNLQFTRIYKVSIRRTNFVPLYFSRPCRAFTGRRRSHRPRTRPIRGMVVLGRPPG